MLRSILFLVTNMQFEKLDRTFVVLGDGSCAEYDQATADSTRCTTGSQLEPSDIYHNIL